MTTFLDNACAAALSLTSLKVYRILLRVDIQKDFCPPLGSLAVPGGDTIVPLANRLSREGGYDEVIDSQDFHPKGHGSFASQHPGKKAFDTTMLNGVFQVLWPEHCQEGTDGCEFHSGLDRSMVKKTVQKGQHLGVDSYSAFYDNGRAASAALKLQYPFLGQSTGLAEYIVAQATAAGADRVEIDVIGLALDYCVAYTAKDAANELYKGQPFAVRVLLDATRAIGDIDIALQTDLLANSVSLANSVVVLPVSLNIG